TSLVGLDLDEAGVEAARAQGYEAHAVDAQSAEAVRALHLPRADVVIAGELIEHLDAPGPFLRAMHELADELVLTTPNAYRVAHGVSTPGQRRRPRHRDRRRSELLGRPPHLLERAALRHRLGHARRAPPARGRSGPSRPRRGAAAGAASVAARPRRRRGSRRSRAPRSTCAERGPARRGPSGGAA